MFKLHPYRVIGLVAAMVFALAFVGCSSERPFIEETMKLPESIQQICGELVDPAVSIKHEDLPSELRQALDDWYAAEGMAGCGICTWGPCGDGCFDNARRRVCTKCPDICEEACR